VESSLGWQAIGKGLQFMPVALGVFIAFFSQV
jgi:hypothetical protein